MYMCTEISKHSNNPTPQELYINLQNKRSQLVISCKGITAFISCPRNFDLVVSMNAYVIP